MDHRSKSAESPSPENPDERESQLPLWPAAPPSTIKLPDRPATPAPGDPSPLSVSDKPAAGSPLTHADPPWKLGDLGLFVLFALVTLFFANAIAIGLFSAFRSGLENNQPLEELLTATPFLVLMQVIWESLWLVFIYYIVAVKYRRPFWNTIRWRSSPPGPKTYLFGGIVLAVAAQGIFSFFPSEESLPIERLFSSPSSGYLLALFGICVAPFMEELVFRGFFYPVFERMWGMVAAVAFTALLFALIHAPQLSGGAAELAAIYCVGLALSYVRGKTGSMFASYLIHLGYNATLFVSLYVATDQFRLLRG
jgi:membrane protease YdiL (CAAX protease family)